MFGVIEEGAIDAGISQDVAAVLRVDGAVTFGQDPFRIFQNPVVFRRTADADQAAIKDFGRFLAWREPLVAGNGQFQGHGLIELLYPVV